MQSVGHVAFPQVHDRIRLEVRLRLFGGTGTVRVSVQVLAFAQHQGAQRWWTVPRNFAPNGRSRRPRGALALAQIHRRVAEQNRSIVRPEEPSHDPNRDPRGTRSRQAYLKNREFAHLTNPDPPLNLDFAD